MDKPFWYPELCNETYFKRLREDYPENADWSDEDLLDYYNEGRKYSITWDHVGDAYREYEPLADDYLRLQSSLTLALDALRQIEEHPHGKEISVDSLGNKFIGNHSRGHRCCAAIAKAAIERIQHD